MTFSRSVLRFGTRSRVALTTLTCGVLLLPVFVASSASAGDDRRGGDLSDLRVCDLSACYLALGVVDSDGDGVADADEIALGSDPLDPASTPPLRLVLDATLDDKLPTYELGFGTWAVFPEEFVKDLEKKWLTDHPTLPSEVFGIPTRRDSFALAGIDDGLLKSLGIDMPWVNGLSFGLASMVTGGKKMGLDLGRFNGSWYGLLDSGTGWWAGNHGGVAEPYDGDDKNTTRYGDLSWSKTKEGTCDLLCTSRAETEYYDKNENKAGSSSEESWVDLKGGYHIDREQRDKNGNVTQETHIVHTNNADGGKTVTITTIDYQRDENGKVTGSTKTTTEKTTDKDGNKSSTTKKQKCDANGQNCTDAMTTGEEGTGLTLPGTVWLSNKEVAAAFDKLLTRKGTTVTPAQDVPDVIGVVTDDDVNAALHRRDLISLFSGDDIATHVGVMVLGAGWNTADPETRPDLPSPLDGATGGGAPGGGGCASGGGTC